MLWFILCNYVCICFSLQLFKKEEQNFVYANEIDNMALIMPSQDKNAIASTPVEKKDMSSGSGTKRKKVKSRMENMTSLNVACLKRLLPIGLNMFGGQEQELVQQAKTRLIEVSPMNLLSIFSVLKCMKLWMTWETQ